MNITAILFLTIISSISFTANAKNLCSDLPRESCWSLADKEFKGGKINAVNYLKILHSSCDNDCYTQRLISKKIQKLGPTFSMKICNTINADSKNPLALSCIVAADSLPTQKVSERKSLLRKACLNTDITNPKDKLWQACFQLGELELSLGNSKEGEELLKGACLNNVWRSCSVLTIHYGNNSDYQNSLKIARISHPILNKKCDEGDITACSALKLNSDLVKTLSN